MPMDESALTELFEHLGAPDAAGWARSQAQEGIPQLARFLFLRQAWRSVVADGDTEWIGGQIENATSNPHGPFAATGLALQRLLETGADTLDLSDVVRGMQGELLFALCYLLSDPGVIEPAVEDVSWALVQLDADGQVLGEIGALHESVLETDPTGREMRPRSAD
jgi:hypothetical protein